MAFTIEFLYEDKGKLKPVPVLDDEVLDDIKIRSIMNLKVFDTIPLGSGSEKRTYEVQKIHRKVQGNDMHFDFVVKKIPDAEYRLGWNVKIAPHHIESRLDRSITPSEMHNLHDAMSKLGDFMNCYNLYEICDKNLQSILSYHNALPTTYEKTNRQKANEFMELSVQEMNRLLLNYLSSFKTFLDHLNTRYSRLEHQGYSCLKDFKKITSVCYDTSFYYRFFYKLRNYVQHCGLPISYMNISEQPDKGSVSVNISIGFDRNALLDSFDWGVVKDDLLKQAERLELLPCLQGFMHEVQNINLVATTIELSIANESWRKLNEIFDEVRKQCPDGEPFIGRLIELQNGETQMNMINFPFHQISKYNEKYLEAQRSIAERKTTG